ncbi:MAG TPA: hypothetical protein VJ719_13475 [Chthoniobacterales bacterium]|nr:hypothetical protein [Chthoniobacterales bacterium]
MKPTSHRAGRKNRDGVNNPFPRRFPLTDYHFQSVTLDGYRGECAKYTRSFRNISSDYFKTEARRNFLTEAVFFGSIVATTIWPVLQSAQAMTDLVRAFSGI